MHLTLCSQKARLALKEQKAARAEAAGVAFMSKVKKRRAEEKRSIPKKVLIFFIFCYIVLGF